MSHELRTPLNAILGFSDMMQGQALGPIGNVQYLSYASDIHESGRHLLGVVNDILDISRIETGDLKLNEEEIDIEGAIEACIRLLRVRAEYAKIKIVARIGNCLPYFYGDARLIKQTIINLLANAIKFSHEGGTVAIRADRDADGDLTVSIADDGIGMAKDDIPRALEPFGQVDSSLARRYEGTGLGLPLAKSFIELHGGDLDIDSEQGLGTTVTVRLPRSRLLPAREPPGQRQTSLAQ
jgi:signal transduction histidine kinase